MSNNRKPTFFTSDLHLNHANSIKFDKRPFKDLEHMHKKLINNWNAIVPENGITYILGDYGMGSVDKTREILDQLNGTKILVLGNHDGGVNRCYNLGFDCVVHGITLYIAGERVTMTHCPLRGVFREDTTGMRNYVEGENWHGESRHTRFSVEDTGQFHLHGHIHSSKHNGKPKIQGRQIDIGMPSSDYRPMRLGAIESLINRIKQQEG